MAQSKQDELYKALQQKGYPDSLCREIAYKQMNTDYTATRMLGYLYRISDPRPEDVVEEMLAILSERNTIIQKKELNIFGSRNALKKDFLELIDLVKAGKVDLEKIVTNTYKLDEADKAFKEFSENAGSMLKVVIDFTK